MTAQEKLDNQRAFLLMDRLNKAIGQINDRHRFLLGNHGDRGWSLAWQIDGKTVETKGYGTRLEMIAEARDFVRPWATLLRYNTHEIILANLEPMNAALDVFGEVAELLGRCEP